MFSSPAAVSSDMLLFEQSLSQLVTPSFLTDGLTFANDLGFSKEYSFNELK